jgi:hypothetical protein
VKAAEDCKLESPFVQIRDLGDFSVTYRVSGLLKAVNRLLDKRRELRRRTMDALHAEHIEIVSPTFMNTRGLGKNHSIIPAVDSDAKDTMPTQSTDALVFDKAEKAESLERLRDQLTEIETRMKAQHDIVAAAVSERAVSSAESEIANLTWRKTRIEALIDRKEAIMSDG